jgi:hypothetical protein
MGTPRLRVFQRTKRQQSHVALRQSCRKSPPSSDPHWMNQLGVSSEDDFNFPPFVRDFWGD